MEPEWFRKPELWAPAIDLGARWLPFSSLWHPLAPFWFLFGCLWFPFGSLLLPLAPFGSLSGSLLLRFGRFASFDGPVLSVRLPICFAAPTLGRDAIWRQTCDGTVHKKRRWDRGYAAPMIVFQRIAPFRNSWNLPFFRPYFPNDLCTQHPQHMPQTCHKHAKTSPHSLKPCQNHV